MKKLIVLLSFIGLAVSVGANVSAMNGAGIATFIPLYFFLLHAGAISLNLAYSKVVYGNSAENVFKEEMKGLSFPLQFLIYALMFYAFFAFINHEMSDEIEIVERGGAYYQRAADGVQATAEEYHKYQAKGLMLFSSIWILAYLRPVIMTFFSRKE